MLNELKGMGGKTPEQLEKNQKPEDQTPEESKKIGKLAKWFDKKGKAFNEVGDEMEIIKEKEAKIAEKQFKKVEKGVKDWKDYGDFNK